MDLYVHLGTSQNGRRCVRPFGGKTMILSKAIVASAVCATLSGCALVTPPIEHPTIEDHSGHLGTFSTVAERRVVITKREYKNMSGDNAYESKFCAEPPPDATQSIASALTAALSGSAAGLKAKPEVSVEFAKSLETTAKSLFQRSQGVQLFRDGLFNLCQASLNGAIIPGEYVAQYNLLLTKASEIIKEEVGKMPSVPVLRAEEAAIASEAAKDAAVKAKVSVMDSKAAIDTSVNKADAAAKKAEDAAKRAEDAANKQKP